MSDYYWLVQFEESHHKVTARLGQDACDIKI